MNLGTIFLNNLKISCIIGILEYERQKEQELSLDITLKIPFDIAEKTEDINQTIDYTTLAYLLTKWVKKEQFLLIETLAKRGCSLILNEFKLIYSCEILVKKPAAVPKANYAGVSYSLSRSEFNDK